MDGAHVVIGSGGRIYEEDDGIEYHGDCAISVLDATDFSPVASRNVEWIGTELGFVSGHVIDWHWYAQSDLLAVQPHMTVDGSDARFESDTFDAFDYCTDFAASGAQFAGTRTSYCAICDADDGNVGCGEENCGVPVVLVGALGTELRAIDAPAPFDNPRSFAFLGFDREQRIVLTIRGLGQHLGGDEHSAWRLEPDDTWSHLGAWTPKADYAVEFSGADGRPVRLAQAELPG